MNKDEERWPGENLDLRVERKNTELIAIELFTELAGGTTVTRYVSESEALDYAARIARAVHPKYIIVEDDL